MAHTSLVDFGVSRPEGTKPSVPAAVSYVLAVRIQVMITDH